MKKKVNNLKRQIEDCFDSKNFWKGYWTGLILECVGTIIVGNILVTILNKRGA